MEEQNPEPRSRNLIARWAEAQSGLTSEMLEAAHHGVLNCLRWAGGEALLSFLHGDWLHEPLHCRFVLDALPRSVDKLSTNAFYGSVCNRVFPHTSAETSSTNTELVSVKP